MRIADPDAEVADTSINSASSSTTVEDEDNELILSCFTNPDGEDCDIDELFDEDYDDWDSEEWSGDDYDETFEDYEAYDYSENNGIDSFEADCRSNNNFN